MGDWPRSDSVLQVQISSQPDPGNGKQMEDSLDKIQALHTDKASMYENQG